MFARTPVAKEFRRWVLDILDRLTARPSLPAATPTDAPLNLLYAGRHFRICRIGGEPWFVSADVATALGLATTRIVLNQVPAEHKAKQVIGKQSLHVISLAGLQRAYLLAHPAKAEALEQFVERSLTQLPAPAPAYADEQDIATRTLQMLRDTRFILTFDSQGRMSLREMEKVTYLPVTRLAEKLLDPEAVPGRLLPDILQAIGQRLTLRA